MYKDLKSYIPSTIGEVWDFVGSMMLNSPTFVDRTGDFPNRSIATEFFALNEGLRMIREEVGEEAFQKLTELSDRMRAHFEADPEDKTEDSLKGRKCIVEMEGILRAATQRIR